MSSFFVFGFCRLGFVFFCLFIMGFIWFDFPSQFGEENT